MGSETAWEVIHNIEAYSGEIAAAVKGGFGVGGGRRIFGDSRRDGRDLC